MEITNQIQTHSGKAKSLFRYSCKTISQSFLSHLIEKVECKRRACVEAEDLDIGVWRQHRRVEADDVSEARDQDTHLQNILSILLYTINT